VLYGQQEPAASALDAVADAGATAVVQPGGSVRDQEVVADLVEVLDGKSVERTVEWRHRPTMPVDPLTGQGFAHVQYAFAAHRAVVDVDVELGLVRVVELACAQDVGRAIHPSYVEGQIQGGVTQGIGDKGVLANRDQRLGPDDKQDALRRQSSQAFLQIGETALHVRGDRSAGFGNSKDSR